MNDAQAPRRAYFASLSTPELIVCATVERGRYTESDLDLIRLELTRRGVDVERLAVPQAPFGEVLGKTPQAYSTPLPWAGRWWGEGWNLFSRHFQFLAALAAVFTLPLLFLNDALSHTHELELSIGLVAHVLFLVAYDSLFTAALFNGLHRRMSEGRGSIGSAVANGLQCWGRVFRESLKAYGMAFGLSLFLFALGRRNDEVALKVWAWIFLVYPGSYLLIRVFWVQALAICKRDEPHLFAQSRRYVKGRLWHMYWFLQILLGICGIGLLEILIIKAILPKPILEAVGIYFAVGMMLAFIKTTVLVGYYHVSAHPDAQPGKVAATALPQPPGLNPQA